MISRMFFSEAKLAIVKQIKFIPKFNQMQRWAVPRYYSPIVTRYFLVPVSVLFDYESM